MGKFKLWVLKLFKQDEHSKREKYISDFMHKYGATHACPQCEVWEHEGNLITTEYYCQSTDKRVCGECDFVFRSIFTPAGHTWLEGYTWEGDKFVEVDSEQ